MNIQQRKEEKVLKCNKCGKDGISNESKICNDCGSKLSKFENIFDDSIYIDKVMKEGERCSVENTT
jgi:rRNA maturation endonuclease Nob1